jgi:hypothetical protein
MFWEHASKAYTVWFDEGAEQFPEAEAELDEFYGKPASPANTRLCQS